MDSCNNLIEFHKAQIRLIEVVHKYMHDLDSDLEWRPTPRTSETELVNKVKVLRTKLGSEVTDEILEAIQAVGEIEFHLKQG